MPENKKLLTDEELDNVNGGFLTPGAAPKTYNPTANLPWWKMLWNRLFGTPNSCDVIGANTGIHPGTTVNPSNITNPTVTVNPVTGINPATGVNPNNVNQCE